MNSDSTQMLFDLFCCVIGIFLGTIPFLVLSIRIVPQSKRISVYRLGRHMGERGPGLVLLIPIIDRGVLMDAPVGKTEDKGELP